MKRVPLLWFPIVTLVVSLNLLSCGSSGGGGSTAKLLDALFGTGGKVTTPIGTIDDTAYALAIQSDEKLVAAGYSYDDTLGQSVFALARYNTDGSLDTTGFNPTGIIPGVVTIAVGADDVINSLIIQPNGKLVVAGYSYDSGLGQYVFTLARYNTDGSLDTAGFNPTGTIPGVVTTAIGIFDDTAYALAIQSDEKLVAAGYSYDDTLGQNVFALARYNTDGSLDTTGFNPTGTLPGVVTTPIGSIGDEAFSLAIQSDGKLVAAGYSDNGTQFELALVRYDPDGSLDTTGFGTGGIMTTAVGDDDAANAVVIQPSDGRLVIAGYSLQGPQYEFVLARYNTDGSLDTAFNPTGTLPGTVTTAIGTVDDTAYGLVIQPDGRLVAAGYSNKGTLASPKDVFALVAYNTDGTLDTTFNSTGKLTTAVGSNDAAQALIIQPDDQLVAAGYSLQSGQYEFALVRYLPLP